MSDIATAAQSVPAWLLGKTFAVQYNPNCPKPWLVRLVGFEAGCLDNKPYQQGETRDALGFGRTCEEAALAAQAIVDAGRAAFQAELTHRQAARLAARSIPFPTTSPVAAASAATTPTETA